MEGISGLGVACAFKLVWNPAVHVQQNLFCSIEHPRNAHSVDMQLATKLCAMHCRPNGKGTQRVDIS